MNKYNRTMVLAASTITALGTLPMASLANAAPPAVEAVAFPASGSYLADLPGQDGMTTTMAITVDGDDVAAYATNGVNDEASFSGAEHNGSIDLTSTYQDHLVAAFDGTAVNGTVTMKDQQNFQEEVRQMRVDRQLQPAPSMMYGTWSVDMNGTPMTAVPVTGDMTF